jgi:hypothetical protein
LAVTLGQLLAVTTILLEDNLLFAARVSDNLSLHTCSSDYWTADADLFTVSEKYFPHSSLERLEKMLIYHL